MARSLLAAFFAFAIQLATLAPAGAALAHGGFTS